MQVIYRLDTNNDGTIDSVVDTISGLTAQQIREQLREVRVYILSHEGQRDSAFRFQADPVNPHLIVVGEFGSGRTFNLSSTIGSWMGTLSMEGKCSGSKAMNLAS